MVRSGIVLEMTAASQLRPSRRIDALAVIEAPAPAASTMARLYRQIWAPLGGGGRSAWTDDQWQAELSQPGAAALVGRLDGVDTAMAQVGWAGDGDAVFVVIGVVPASQGRGIGGDFLSRLTRRLWSTPAPNGRATRRVWLWTVPDEHPHTIPNYLARGFVRGADLAR